MNKCCMCGKFYKGYGNNPYPLRNYGRCCNNCNIKVIQKRLDNLKEDKYE